jgi:hypothetical protein
MTFACAAEDTLGDAQGDPAEGLTAAALQWLSTGACGAVMDAGAAVLQQAGTAASRYPRPARPSAAQIWMPGLQ